MRGRQIAKYFYYKYVDMAKMILDSYPSLKIFLSPRLISVTDVVLDNWPLKGFINSWNVGRIREAILRPPLDKGERYDPIMGRDPCHTTRYHFASSLANREDTVLDIACGTGYGSEILSRKFKKIVGVDHSSDAIEYARANHSRHNIEFKACDLFHHNDKFDFVVSFETIEHIKNRDFKEILDKIIQLSLKRLVVSVPYKEKKGQNPHHHHYDLDESDFTYLEDIGEMKMFYQYREGEIVGTKRPNTEAQNLIVFIEKFWKDIPKGIP